ncbi:MAG: sialidase family protein [Planctomycetota bacterium]
MLRLPATSSLILALALSPAAQKPDVRIDLGNPPGAASSHAVRLAAAGKDAVYAVWADDRNGLTDIYFNVSTTAGYTWLPMARRIDTGNPAGSTTSCAPQMAVEGNSVYVVWSESRAGAEDIYFNRSPERGATWLASSIRLDRGVPGRARSSHPQIAAWGDAVYVVWADERNGAGWDIYLNRSLDRGNSWLTTDVRLDVSSSPGAAFSFQPRIAAAGNMVCVVWSDFRNGNTDVYANVSTTQGTTWLATDQRLDTDGPGSAASHNVSVAAVDANLFVAWEDLRNGGNADIYFNRSRDLGTTWLPQDLRLDLGRAPGASDARSPQVAAFGAEPYVVWSDDRNGATDIYFNRSPAGGTRWSSSPLRVDLGSPAGAADSIAQQLVVTDSEVYAAWADDREAAGWSIRFNRTDRASIAWQATDIRLDSTVAPTAAPQAPALAAGDSTVYAAWEDMRAGAGDVHFTIPFGFQPYGSGSPGTGSVIPDLTGDGLTVIGATPTVTAQRALGGSLGVVLFGIGPSSQIAVPVLGSTVLVLPIFSRAVGLGGPAGQPAEGSVTLPVPIPLDPVLRGLNINLQVGVRDAGVPSGMSLTNAVQLWVG